MRRPLLLHLALAAAFVAVAQPGWAGTAYVPVTANLEIQGVKYETVLWISNLGSTTGGFTTRFIPTNSDGSPGEGQASQTLFLTPGGTFYLRPLAPEGSLGILEVTTDAGMVAEARLVGRPIGGPEGLGASVPLLNSENLAAAGQTVTLQGLERNLFRMRSNLGIINPNGDTASCSVSVFRANNSQIQQTAVVSVPAFGHREFYDALGILGEATAEHVRTMVSCDQPFYAYATLVDIITGEVAFTGPSLKPDLGTSGDPGGGGDPGPGGGGECPAGALCFSRPGVFYRPTPSESVRRETFELANGSYKRIHMRVEVFHGGWRNPSSGLHSLFWLAINRHFRLIGFSGFHGPNKNDILFRHGMDLPAGDKPKFTRPFNATPGQVYVCDFDFNAAGHHLEFKVTDLQGNVLLSITDVPNVNRIVVGDNEDLVADFSTLAGQNPIEPPTYGWEYRNLTVEVYP